MKDDGIPFRTVWDNSFVARKVMKIEKEVLDKYPHQFSGGRS